MAKEVEVFGISYDRYVLMNLHKIMAHRWNLKKIIEMPSHGAKAAGSLYSIGFGLVGCHVTLVNPEMEMIKGWIELRIGDRVETISEVDVNHAPFQEGEFDLAWNFVTWTELENPWAYLLEMKRVSKNYVLLVTCNNFQPGYPWHRLMHKLYGFPWTHGQVKYNHIHKVKTLFVEVGLKVIEYGAIDSPGWPDPLVPIRDIRLHRKFSGESDSPEWEVPILRYVKRGHYPTWMRVLGRWDIGFRKSLWKLPLSHLFYVLGRV